ncbi:MAG: hypothetical protein WBG90_17765 [Saonia sp.]
MKTKKILFGLLTCVTLLAVSCDSSSATEDDQLYEQGIDRKKLVRK